MFLYLSKLLPTTTEFYYTVQLTCVRVLVATSSSENEKRIAFTLLVGMHPNNRKFNIHLICNSHILLESDGHRDHGGIGELQIFFLSHRIPAFKARPPKLAWLTKYFSQQQK